MNPSRFHSSITINSTMQRKIQDDPEGWCDPKKRKTQGAELILLSKRRLRGIAHFNRPAPQHTRGNDSDDDDDSNDEHQLIDSAPSDCSSPSNCSSPTSPPLPPSSPDTPTTTTPCTEEDIIDLVSDDELSCIDPKEKAAQAELFALYSKSSGVFSSHLHSSLVFVMLC